MKLATVVAVLLWTALMQGCKDEPVMNAGEPAGAVDRSQLCSGGGATLNAATNECVCPTSQTWNGLRCEAGATAAAPTTTAGATATEAHSSAESAHEAGIELHGQPEPAAPAPAAAPLPEPPVAQNAPEKAPIADAAAVGGDDKALASACHRAKGQWLPKDGYCLCPAGAVLVGPRCRMLPGVVTEAACRYAVHKGRWKKWQCECDEGLVFAPSRGGCVPRVKDAAVVLRRECESSLNRGKWDAAGNRCRCQDGRVWLDERCQPRRELSSREICESDDDAGKWDDEHRRCRCPGGRVWLDQTCRSASGVEPKALCESEAGGGQWNAQVGKCICPKLAHWDDAAKQCTN